MSNVILEQKVFVLKWIEVGSYSRNLSKNMFRNSVVFFSFFQS